MNVEELNQLTGLHFKQHGQRFYGAFYLDGTPHERPDKTNARMKDGEIWVSEEGGECLHIKQWLKLYGDESKYVRPDKIDEAPKVERKFVSPEIYNKTFPELYQGNLFLALSRIFGVLKTHEAFHRYSVGESNKRDTIFWYRDSSGAWLHDQVVPYLKTGKRDKSLKYPGWRKCKNEHGYTGKGVFGGHLIKAGSEVCVVESEKTALIMSMVEKRGRIWVGTGGSNKTAAIREGNLLFPDFDAAGKFWECISCQNRNKAGCIIEQVIADGRSQKVKDWGCKFANKNLRRWFEGQEVEDGDDCADYVLKNIRKK